MAREVSDKTGIIPPGSKSVGNQFYVTPVGRNVMIRLGGDYPDVPLDQSSSGAGNRVGIREITASTNITTDDYTIVFLVAGIVQSLPINTKGYVFNLFNDSDGPVTITGSINGMSAGTLQPKENLQVQARDNSGNYIIL